MRTLIGPNGELVIPRDAHEAGQVIGLLKLALEEALRLNAHYASLLNQYDSGNRRGFATMEDWLKRLRDIRTRGFS